MTSARLLRTQINLRRERGANRASHTTRTTGPNFGRGSNNGPFSKATVAAKKFARVLSSDSVGDIATAAGVSKETAKNWKLGKRMPNGEAMLDLGTNLRSVKGYIRGRIDGHDSVEAQHACAEVEAFLQSLPPEQAAAVRAQLSARQP